MTTQDDIDAEGRKLCSGCGQRKPADAAHFTPPPHLRSSWSSACRDCIRARARLYYRRKQAAAGP